MTRSLHEDSDRKKLKRIKAVDYHGDDDDASHDYDGGNINEDVDQYDNSNDDDDSLDSVFKN